MIGQRINNNYDIQAEIARGGMATVYRAHQISMNRDVAIKILPREFLHETSFLERFKQEVEISSRLEHRSIVPVYDYGEWEGMPYIVMRYMEGRSVDSLLENGPISLQETQDIIRQVASALDYAHSQNVLHRDLKPSNILLDRNGDAYITDFGIARIQGHDVKLTATGVVGTPAYMSPEQAQGLDLDGRSDIYALGVMAFEMLTGRRPFEADTPYGIAVMHVTKQPPSPREINPSLAVGVAQVVLRALDKDRERRYRTANELAGALDDADLMPLPASNPDLSSTQPHTPPATVYPHQYPTPQRPTASVIYPQASLSRPMTRRSRSPILYFVFSVLMAVVGAAMLLGVYLLFMEPETVTNTPPNFAATGRAHLTQTAENFTSGGAVDMTGQVIYVSEGSDLFLLDLSEGRQVQMTETSGAIGEPALSPDGQWLAYVYDPDGDLDNISDSQIELYIRRVDGSGERQITSNLLRERNPVWLPDSTGLIYAQELNGLQGYRLIQIDLATQTPENIYQVVGKHISDPTLSPDGQSLVFAVGQPEIPDSWELFRFDLDTNQEIRLTDNALMDWGPMWGGTAEEPQILFLRLQENSQITLMTMQPDGGNPVALYDATGIIGRPSLSADKTLILWGSTTGLTAFNLATGIAQPISRASGSNPLWVP